MSRHNVTLCHLTFYHVVLCHIVTSHPIPSHSIPSRPFTVVRAPSSQSTSVLMCARRIPAIVVESVPLVAHASHVRCHVPLQVHASSASNSTPQPTPSTPSPRHASPPPSPPPSSPVRVRVLGVVRSSEVPSAFVPANEPSRGLWFWLDVPSMARHCGLPPDTLYIEQAPAHAHARLQAEGHAELQGGEEEEGEAAAWQSGPQAAARGAFPIPKDPEALVKFSVMPGDHISYAATW